MPKDSAGSAGPIQCREAAIGLTAAVGSGPVLVTAGSGLALASVEFVPDA